MIINPGDTIYNYTLKNEVFRVHEVRVIESGHSRKIAYFKDSRATRCCPKRDEIGVVLSTGPTLWLPTRDDELAKRLFIEYEEKCIAMLREQIDKKSELIKLLKEL